MLAGAWGWFRVWRRVDYQPLFWTAVCVMAGIWVHMWYAQATSSRYWLSIVLLGCPFAALGLARVAKWIARGVQRIGPRMNYAAALLVVICGYSAYGWADALSSGDDHGRRGEAALGRWLAASCDADARLLMPATMPVCRYYTAAGERVITADCHSYEIADLLVTAEPDVAVSSRRKSRGEVCLAFIEAAARHGLTPVAPDELPPECDSDDLIVFVRTSRFAEIGKPRLER